MTLTITHIKVPDAITNTTDGNAHLYAIGYDPPRYPVPALIETVKFHQHGMISIQHAQGGWIRAWWKDGHWGYETSGAVHYVD